MHKDILKKSEIKRLIAKRGFRINTKNISYISKIVNMYTLEIITKIIRNARISGRKTIKKEDFKEI